MKKFLLATIMIMSVQASFAMDTVFDSMDSATEVKIKPTNAANLKETIQYNNSNGINTSIQEQKYNSALVSLDDAQVELRQDLTIVTTRYNDALAEKKRAIANCKAIKKEMNSINKKMKNVEKSKKIINKNLENKN